MLYHTNYVKKANYCYKYTESEIVAISDGMSSIMGLPYLLGEQGCDIKPLILYQDGKPAITIFRK